MKQTKGKFLFSLFYFQLEIIVNKVKQILPQGRRKHHMIVMEVVLHQGAIPCGRRKHHMIVMEVVLHQGAIPCGRRNWVSQILKGQGANFWKRILQNCLSRKFKFLQK